MDLYIVSLGNCLTTFYQTGKLINLALDMLPGHLLSGPQGKSHSVLSSVPLFSIQQAMVCVHCFECTYTEKYLLVVLFSALIRYLYLKNTLDLGNRTLFMTNYEVFHRTTREIIPYVTWLWQLVEWKPILFVEFS